MRFGTKSVRNLYSSGSLKTAARKVARYTLDLVGVQEVRWKKEDTVRAGTYTIFTEKEKKIIDWEQDFSYTTELCQ